MANMSLRNDLPFVSVIIPVLNEEKHVGECLRSFLQQDYPADRFELLFVDGGSSDSCWDIVSGFIRHYPHYNMRLLRNPRRITPCAMNIGIKNAKGSVIMLFNAHSFAAPDFIRMSVRYLFEKDVVCVGGTYGNRKSSSLLEKASFLAQSSAFGVATSPTRFSKKEQYVDKVLFGAFKRQVFDEIGFFDETLPVAQTTDFYYRIRSAGHRIFFTPRIRFFYHPRDTFLEFSKYALRWGHGRGEIVKRHPDFFDWKYAIPSLFVATLTVLGIGSLFSSLFRYLLLLVLGVYSICATVFALKRVDKKEDWKAIGVLPLLFFMLHLGYGLGLICSLLEPGNLIGKRRAG